jgi:predicted RNA binding protein YcfA (HicA-like mRNA interferase family)
VGVRIVRQKGSHVFYRHEDGRFTTLPHHKGQDISRPLIRKILNEVRMTPEDYIAALQD